MPVGKNSVFAEFILNAVSRIAFVAVDVSRKEMMLHPVEQISAVFVAGERRYFRVLQCFGKLLGDFIFVVFFDFSFVVFVNFIAEHRLRNCPGVSRILTGNVGKIAPDTVGI